jgi:hypothetical protein
VIGTALGAQITDPWPATCLDDRRDATPASVGARGLTHRGFRHSRARRTILGLGCANRTGRAASRGQRSTPWVSPRMSWVGGDQFGQSRSDHLVPCVGRSMLLARTAGTPQAATTADSPRPGNRADSSGGPPQLCGYTSTPRFTGIQPSRAGTASRSIWEGVHDKQPDFHQTTH